MLWNLIKAAASSTVQYFSTSWKKLFGVYNEINARKVRYYGGYAYMCGSHQNTPAVFRSNDGVNWEVFIVDSGSTTILFDICYNGTNWIVVGQGGKAYRSTDLTNWTLITGFFGSGDIYRISHSGTNFGLGCGAEFFTSPDGITWTKKGNLPSTVLAVVWDSKNNTRWLAVITGGNYVYASPDGVNWIASSTYLQPMYDITCEGGYFAACGPNSFVAIGPTMGSLAQVSIPVSAIECQSIQICNGAWFVGNSTLKVLKSTDLTGSTWGATSIGGTGNYFYSFGYINGTYFGGGVIISADGSNWYLRKIGLNGYINRLVYANGRYLGVGYPSAGRIFYSDDGKKWSIPKNLDNTTIFTSCAFGNGKWVVVGTNGSIYYSTNNGVNWTQGWTSVVGTLYDVFYDTETAKWIAVGNNLVLNSTDGVNWNAVSTATQLLLQIIRFGNNYFGFGNTSNFFKATKESAGNSWTSSPVPYNARITAAISLDSRILIGGDSGRIYASSDLISWNAKSNPATSTITDFAFRNGRVYAVTSDGKVMISDDLGDSWAMQQVFGTAVPLTAVDASNTEVVIVGYNESSGWLCGAVSTN